jgi:hypothetical protein
MSGSKRPRPERPSSFRLDELEEHDEDDDDNEEEQS